MFQGAAFGRFKLSQNIVVTLHQGQNFARDPPWRRPRERAENDVSREKLARLHSDQPSRKLHMGVLEKGQRERQVGQTGQNDQEKTSATSRRSFSSGLNGCPSLPR